MSGTGVRNDAGVGVRHLAVAAVAALIGVGALRACAYSDLTVPGAEPAALIDARMECLAMGYPCKWAEVDPATLARTSDLADEAMDRLERGEGIEAVAAWLEARDGMGSVLHDELLIRFHLARGRPVWVGSPEAAALGIRGGGQAAGLPAGSPKADPVGEQTPGVRPEKSFLFLDPYRYEFYMDVLSGRIDPANDASNAIPKLLAQPRDYTCTEGQPCRCPDGRCFQYLGNDWVAMCDPSSPACEIHEGVTLDAYKMWDRYDVIHVASHGATLCNADNSHCPGGFASGRFVLDDLKTLAESHRIATSAPPLYADWMLEPGIELFRLGLPPGHCKYFTPGTPGYAFARCDQVLNRVWREYLTGDFFIETYRHRPLKDKLIFLAACVTISKRGTLAGALAGPDSDNAVVGWRTYVFNSVASMASTAFYKEWLGGKTAYDAVETVKRHPYYAGLGFVGNEGMLRGAAQAGASPGTTALPGIAGLPRKRGVETVRLLDPGSGLELRDGGTLPLLARTGGEDTLDAVIEAFGLDADEDPDAYALAVRVDGRNAPHTPRFNLEAGTGTHRYRGPIALGQTLEPERPVDVEISADLPGGGETRWLYYDLVPRRTWWEVTVAGGPVTFPVLSGGSLQRRMNVIVGMDEAPPVLFTQPPLSIAVPLRQMFLEGENSGMVTIRFRDPDYTCVGAGGGGLTLTLFGVDPLDGAFDGRVICTPGTPGPATFRDAFRRSFGAHATGRFRAR